MIKRLKLGMAALALVVSLPVAAVDRGDPAAGERKSATCAGCHGQAGRSTNPQYPVLAGQYADYLYRTLVDYKTGARQNAVMKGMVANLSEEDMWDLAAYYAAQSSDLYTMDR